MKKRMSEIDIKLWVINEAAGNIVSQLKLYSDNPRAISYCIGAAEGIQARLKEVTTMRKLHKETA